MTVPNPLDLMTAFEFWVNANAEALGMWLLLILGFIVSAFWQGE